jgi:hypothetical protein
VTRRAIAFIGLMLVAGVRGAAAQALPATPPAPPKWSFGAVGVSF